MDMVIRENVKGEIIDLKSYPVKCPEYFNFAYDIIDNWAARTRNQLAMIWVNQQGEEKRYTFREIARLSNQAANLLVKMGVRKGDKVFMMIPRLPQWWIFSLAMIRLGALQCPSPSLLTSEDIQYRVNAGKFKFIITDKCAAEKVDEVFDKCPTLQDRLIVEGEREGWVSYEKEISAPNAISQEPLRTAFRGKTKTSDPMLIMFTSGTSCHPKMVLHNHGLPLGHRVTAELWHGSTTNDLQLTISDTGWGKNIWSNYFGQWIMGACLLIYDIRGKFHPEELLPLIEKYEVTIFCAPPTIYRMLVLSDLSKYNLSNLRSCTAAGEPLHTETVKIWKQGTGLDIREAYGQTETAAVIGTWTDVEPLPGSMGKASPDMQIELHDEDVNEVPQGEDGRIAIKIKDGARPAGLLECYLANDEENAKCFVNGYYYTGDKAWLDENGYYHFVGRSDDIIKSSGYRIGPLEVEDVLMKHPAIVECAVIGVPDPLRGARVKAYVILKDGYEPTESMIKELQAHAKSHSAPYKYPREIEFVKSLPKTISGKVKRELLRRHSETGEDVFDK